MATIFSSLQLFNVSPYIRSTLFNIKSILSQIIRAPLMFLPIVFAALSDALVALGRISKFLNAEELAELYKIDYEMKHAVTIDADFTWETAGKLEENKFAIGTHGQGRKMGGGVTRKKGRETKSKAKREAVLPTVVQTALESSTKEPEEKPFELKGVKFNIPKGAFVAIVGRVGSGKVCLQNIPC